MKMVSHPQLFRIKKKHIEKLMTNHTVSLYCHQNENIFPQRIDSLLKFKT